MVRSSNKARRGRRAGFTLIELLVVVLILGILIAVAIPLYLSSVKNASRRTTMANLKTIAQAAQAYKVKTGNYPTNVAALTLTTQTGGADLEQTPTGPRGVTYEFSPGTAAVSGGAASTPATVTATENGQDAFGPEATNNTATYTMQTGAYAGID